MAWWGTMPLGAGGFHDQVDNHYLRLVSMALLLSAFTAGIEMSQPQTTSASGLLSPSAEATQALGQQFGQLGMEVTRKNLNIQPTVKIRPGYRFNVRVNRDIAFAEPYARYRSWLNRSPSWRLCIATFGSMKKSTDA